MAASGRRIYEGSAVLIRDYVKAHIAAALAVVRADRADPIVTTEPPYTTSYFFYPTARGYKTPAVFVIAGPANFQKRETGANFINASIQFRVSAVVEDKDRNRLEYKAWRYHSALHELLDQTELTSGDGKIKIAVVVNSSDPSPPFTNGQDENAPDTLWRKEIVLECEVHHYESF